MVSHLTKSIWPCAVPSLWEGLQLSGPSAGDTGLPRALSQPVPALRVGTSTLANLPSLPLPAFPASSLQPFVCLHSQPSALHSGLVGAFVLFPGTLRKDLALDDSKKPQEMFKDDKC